MCYYDFVKEHYVLQSDSAPQLQQWGVEEEEQLQICTTLNCLRESKKQHSGFDPEKILKI
jgi:hypothetical protein